MIFSVRLSIVAETMKPSVSSSVLLLTKYETDWRALSKLSFKSFSTLIAVSKSILMENEDDNNIVNINPQDAASHPANTSVAYEENKKHFY